MEELLPFCNFPFILYNITLITNSICYLKIAFNLVIMENLSASHHLPAKRYISFIEGSNEPHSYSFIFETLMAFHNFSFSNNQATLFWSIQQSNLPFIFEIISNGSFAISSLAYWISIWAGCQSVDKVSQLIIGVKIFKVSLDILDSRKFFIIYTEWKKELWLFLEG